MKHNSNADPMTAWQTPAGQLPLDRAANLDPAMAAVAARTAAEFRAAESDACVTLHLGEVVARVDAASGGRYSIRRSDGSTLVCLGGMPAGYWVGDYIDDRGRYLGPDPDGFEPTWEIVES